MATVAVLEAVLRADTRGFDNDLDKSEKRMGKFGSVMKTGLLGVGAAVGVGLAGALKVGFDEFKEGELVAAQTTAVLKSTGGAAKVTAKEVENLAGAISRKSGVDDAAIQKGQNLLLTFTGIRNETGKNNDIFNQATQIMTDMSVAMGTEASASAIGLGKALNDPVKGVTALTKVGVTFTDAQKESIKAMQEHGDVAGAQKVILAELQKEFGGSAEAAGQTFAGQINIAKNAMANLAGEGVGLLMPKLTQFAGYVIETIIPRIQEFVKNLTGNESVRMAFGALKDFIVTTFFPTLVRIGELFGEVMGAVKRVLESKKEEIATIIGGIKAIMEGIHLVIQNVVIPALKLLFKAGGPFDIAFSLAIDIIAGVVTAITKIVKAFVSVKEWVEKHWGTISSIIEKSPMVLTLKLMAAYLERMVDSIKWLIDNLKRLPSLDFSIGGGDDPFKSGDAHDPKFGTGFNLMGASPVMAPFAASAAGFGLHVTSGLRPGAITANGTPSDHGIGKALDVADGAASMAAFFKSLVGNRSVKQAFYDPLGSIFGGAWSSYREGGHSDHVHVATYDRGGVLKPGWTAAFNGTGRNEYVTAGGPPVTNVYLTNAGVLGSEREVIGWLKSAFQRDERRG